MGISGTDWLEVIPIETTMLDVMLSTHSYGNGYLLEDLGNRYYLC